MSHYRQNIINQTPLVMFSKKENNAINVPQTWDRNILINIKPALQDIMTLHFKRLNQVISNGKNSFTEGSYLLTSI